MPKTCYIVAGPNGAGKTTFAESFLAEELDCPHFINADLIAKGLSPLRPELARVEAGKTVFRKIDEFSRAGLSFCFESTLSGKGYVGRLKGLKSVGYRVVIYFLKLRSEELAVERVRNRVVEGGHDVPAVDIQRRFLRGWSNFLDHYQGLADEWFVIDNSGESPIVIDSFHE